MQTAVVYLLKEDETSTAELNEGTQTPKVSGDPASATLSQLVLLANETSDQFRTNT